MLQEAHSQHQTEVCMLLMLAFKVCMLLMLAFKVCTMHASMKSTVQYVQYAALTV